MARSLVAQPSSVLAFEPVKRSRLWEDIVTQILQLMGDGNLTAGSRLPSERELASRLGVSRPSVREAVICVLAAIEGVLEVGHSVIRRRRSRKYPVSLLALVVVAFVILAFWPVFVWALVDSIPVRRAQ